ncbi:IS630 family transposase [Rhizophagus clarus]|uniref:IS630 family transposase n=1 Tax=Rhizophagus clarus TaxID=94130 RepID=A0A8H3QNI3_9GLOM|nr:IS630 family transposase [Rhizophagus clarus]
MTRLTIKQRAQAIIMIERDFASREIAVKIVNKNIEVSADTVCRILTRNGLVSRVKHKKPLLFKKYQIKWLNFAKRFKNWTISNWSKVVWSDESKFQIFGLDEHQYCWKKLGELLKNTHVKPTVKIDGGLDAELYCQILDEDLMETLQYYELNVSDIVFQQDNDLKHTAILTKQWFDDNNVEIFSWPPQSPDLNLIEYL